MTTLLRYPRNVIALGGPDGCDLDKIDASVERIGERELFDLVRRSGPRRGDALIVRLWTIRSAEAREDLDGAAPR